MCKHYVWLTFLWPSKEEETAEWEYTPLMKHKSVQLWTNTRHMVSMEWPVRGWSSNSLNLTDTLELVIKMSWSTYTEVVFIMSAWEKNIHWDWWIRSKTKKVSQSMRGYGQKCVNFTQLKQCRIYCFISAPSRHQLKSLMICGLKPWHQFTCMPPCSENNLKRKHRWVNQREKRRFRQTTD